MLLCRVDAAHPPAPGVVADVLDCNSVVNGFEFQLCYYVPLLCSS